MLERVSAATILCGTRSHHGRHGSRWRAVTLYELHPSPGETIRVELRSATVTGSFLGIGQVYLDYYDADGNLYNDDNGDVAAGGMFTHQKSRILHSLPKASSGCRRRLVWAERSGHSSMSLISGKGERPVDFTDVAQSRTRRCSTETCNLGTDDVRTGSYWRRAASAQADPSRPQRYGSVEQRPGPIGLASFSATWWWDYVRCARCRDAGAVYAGTSRHNPLTAPAILMAETAQIGGRRWRYPCRMMSTPVDDQSTDDR